MVCPVFGAETLQAMRRSETYSCALPLEYIAEVLEVRVPPADDGVSELEGWNIRARVDFIGGVHGSRRRAMCLRILDLQIERSALLRTKLRAIAPVLLGCCERGSANSDSDQNIPLFRGSSLEDHKSPRRSAAWTLV